LCPPTSYLWCALLLLDPASTPAMTRAEIIEQKGGGREEGFLSASVGGPSAGLAGFLLVAVLAVPVLPSCPSLHLPPPPPPPPPPRLRSRRRRVCFTAHEKGGRGLCLQLLLKRAILPWGKQHYDVFCFPKRSDSPFISRLMHKDADAYLLCCFEG